MLSQTAQKDTNALKIADDLRRTLLIMDPWHWSDNQKGQYFFDRPAVRGRGRHAVALHRARAVTIGKDMVFRDYAQGAFRMRGIGKGQKIHLYLIPEPRHGNARRGARDAPPLRSTSWRGFS